METRSNSRPSNVPGQKARTGPASSTKRHDAVRKTRGLRQGSQIHLVPARRSVIRPRTEPHIRRAYARMIHELKAQFKISVRKWRAHMCGVAFELLYPDGRIRRFISAPRPRSPISAAIFLHEVGHHAVGFQRYSPRCLEEFYVWQWALREMIARDIPITPGVLRHYHRSMHHYVRLAHKSNASSVPEHLRHFLHSSA